MPPCTRQCLPAPLPAHRLRRPTRRAAGPAKRASRLGGIAVLGRPDEAAAICPAVGIEAVLVTAGSVSGKELRKLMEECRAAGVSLKVIPTLDMVLDGRQRVTVRDV